MNPGSNEWYTISNVNELDTPTLVVYPQRVKQNIQTAIQMAGNVTRLRPHVKTHKSKDVTRLMMEAGITKFKCATIAEAEMLGQCGAPDVLLAYQPFGPKLSRLISLIKTYPETTYSCLIDNPDSAEAIANAAKMINLKMPVFIDVNIGMNRTGIVPVQAVKLYTSCLGLNGINIIGLHVYEGHITDADPAIRTQRSNEAYSHVESLHEQLNTLFEKDLTVIMGGSPTLPVHVQRLNVECSPGTFVYWDKGYSDLYPDMKFVPAALVVTRVVSVPDHDVVCVDLGHKSIAAENAPDRRVWFINEPGATFISHSEEHLVLRLTGATNRKVGDVLYGMPFHICPTCALYDYAVTIENGQATGEWKTTSRDRRITV